MLPNDLAILLRLYAERGLSDWKGAPNRVREIAGRCLGGQIAENMAEAHVTLATTYRGGNASRLRFIPMPDFPSNRGFAWSFFIPLIEYEDQKLTVEYNLFVLIDGTHWLAYRFEPAHSRSVHDYGHVQLCQELVRKTLKPSPVMGWLPARYPAFALGTSDPLVMFLMMATSLHGKTGGLYRIISEIFLAASRPREIAQYIDRLRTSLA